MPTPEHRRGSTQTRLVLGATAQAAAGQYPREVERVRAKHHAIQRIIPRLDVVIPYAEVVAEHYPEDRVESRREFRHLL